MIFEILYLVTAFLWGMFAAIVNSQLHPEASIFRHMICFIANAVCMPIAMVTVCIECANGTWVIKEKP